MKNITIKKLLKISLLVLAVPMFSQWTSFGATNRYFYGTYNGNICTWGDVYNSGRLVPIGLDLITDQYGTNDPSKVSRGKDFTVVLRLDKSIWGWGKTDFGQLGTYRANSILNPTKLNYYKWKDIAAGESHVLAIREDGTLWAWGRNYYGEVGTGNTTAQMSPVQIGTDSDWEKIYTSPYSSFAVKTNGTLWAWGYNTLGTLGDGTFTNKTSPVQIGTSTNWLNAKIITTSANSVFAINGLSVYAWGRNSYTLLNGTSANINTPTLVSNNFKSIAGNSNYGIGVKNDGTLWAWGTLPSSTFSPTPVQIGTDTDWLNVATGTYASIILKDGAEKTLWSFGANTAFEIPDSGYNSSVSGNELHKIVIVDPVVRTYVPGLFENYSIYLLGKKIEEGSSAITESGFYVSTTNRTPGSSNTTLTGENFYTGARYSALTGGVHDTTYYVSSYAKNSSSGTDTNGSYAQGNSYGNVAEISTNSAPVIKGIWGFIALIMNNEEFTSGAPLQSATLSSDNLKPNSNVKVTLHSRSRELANISVSSSGGVNFNIPFPTDLEPGVHQIIISGINQYDEAFNESFNILVNADGMVSMSEKIGFKYLPENTTSVFNSLGFSDSDAGQTVTYSIAGGDSSLFTIDSATGKLDFIQAPDFENPLDSNKDNIYEVYLLATDNGSVPKSDVYLLKIKVRDVKETPIMSAIEQIYLGNKTVSIKGGILNTGGDAITEKGYFIATGTKDANLLQEGLSGVSKVLVSTPVANDLSIIIGNLTPDTDYSLRYFAKNSSGIGYSGVLNIHTLADAIGPKIMYTTPYYYNNSIYAISTNHGTAVTAPANSYGTVSTFAGSTEGDANGSTLLTSKFNAPMGILLDAERNIYFADQYNHKIKKISREIDGSLGAITVLAGSTSGAIDATGTSAKFNYPTGLTYDGSSAIYVADYSNGKIRKVTLQGVVTTIASGFSKPTDVLYKMENGTAYLYVADAGNHCIKKVNLTDNTVSIFAGTSGTSGTSEGAITAAKFNNPTGLAFTIQGILYVVDRGNNKIRKIENGIVSTFAGSGTAATTDGNGIAAAFDDPYGILLDGQENIYVTQAPAGIYPSSNPGFSSGATTNNYIRKISPSGTVSTFAGKGTKGITNNTVPTEALLSVPTHLAIDKDTNVMYVSEWMGDDIRSIDLAKGYEISPVLPSGLSFNTSNGVISGTATTQISPSEYTVTASNYYGSSSAPVSFILKSLPQTSVEILTNQIYDTNAWVNSTISSAGNVPILERGICWSKTNSSPTVNDSKTIIENNTASQNTQLYGLEPNTLYYVRAYVMTAAGISYSPWVVGTEGNPSFYTKQKVPSFYYQPNTSYEVSSNVNIDPVIEGGAPSVDYEVSPSLPTGLSINPGNGQITGVPSQATPLTTYVVKTSNASGISYAILNFEVVSSSLAAQNILKDNSIRLISNPIESNLAEIYFKDTIPEAIIDVFDTTGKLLIHRKLGTKELKNHVYSFDFQWSSGLYFVRVTYREGVKTLKLIKK